MKERPREESRFLTFFACLLLNAGLTLGSIFCPITAFHLPVDEVQLAALLVLVCLLASVLYRFRWAGLLLLGLWVLTLAGAFLLAREELEQGARFLYTRLTTIYHTAYSFLQLPAWRPRTSGNVTLLLALWGGALACVNAWVIRRRQSVAPALLLDALPLALCLVVVDTPPDLWCLALLLAAVCLLLLTQSSRIRSPRGGSRLTLGLALPVTALLLALCLLIPPVTYARTQTAEEILQAALDWAGDMLPLELDSHGRLRLAVSVAGNTTADVDLRMGPRLPSHRTVMEVLAEETGSLYLRGSAFGSYTGVSWDRLPEEAFAGCLEPEAGLLAQSRALEGSQTLSIRSRTYLSEIYTPYYLGQLPEVGVPRQDSGLQNQGRTAAYNISYWNLSSNIPSSEDAQPVSMVAGVSIPFPQSPSEYERFIQDGGLYTALPEASRRALRDIAQDAGLTGLSQADLPQAVADFVRDSARYDLNTSRMPSGQEDFASWFLTQSDTGYCVHFAASTAAMLRALDIPARMVTGYLVDAKEDTWVEVTGENAHAWAEYYCLGVGWVPLEATPSDGVASTLRGEGATAPESHPDTEPDVTEPSSLHTAEQTDPARDPGDPTSPGSVPASTRLQLPPWLIWALALLSLALLRRPATLLLRRWVMGRESPNRQLLHRWRLALPLSKLLRQSPPEEMEALALKARFSQHTITREELKKLAHWQAALASALQKAPWWRRLYARWIRILT